LAQKAVKNLGRKKGKERAKIAFFTFDGNSLPGKLFSCLLAHGYPGRLYPVNPKYEAIQWLKAYPPILEISKAVDLVYLVVRACLVSGLLEDCFQKSVCVMLVFSSGFAEEGDAGGELEEGAKRLVATSTLRVLLGQTQKGL
jgi:acyl-CoA synthetase (NDP forming)